MAEETATNDNNDGDYGGSKKVKFQIEWLLVEGTVPQFLDHLCSTIESYSPHIYEVQLSNCVHRCDARVFTIDPVTRQDCPEEFNNVVSEVVDFTSTIHAKREHDLTYSFPKTHNCEVHHLTFSPKFVTVNEIEQMGHKRPAKNLRKRNIDRVL